MPPDETGSTNTGGTATNPDSTSPTSIAEAPEFAMGVLYTMVGQASGLAATNATQMSQQGGIILEATTVLGVSKLLGTSTSALSNIGEGLANSATSSNGQSQQQSGQ